MTRAAGPGRLAVLVTLSFCVAAATFSVRTSHAFGVGAVWELGGALDRGVLGGGAEVAACVVGCPVAADDRAILADDGGGVC